MVPRPQLPPAGRRRSRRPLAAAVAVAAVALLALATVLVVRVGTADPDATPTAGPAVPASTPTATAVFIGDSYSAGVGITEPGYRWPAQVCAARGWAEVNVSTSGTGYVNDASGTGLPYAAQAGEVAGLAPDVVVVSGGRNDLNADLGADRETIAAAVLTTFATLRAELPRAELLAVSPVWDSTTPPPDLAWLGEQVRTAVEAVGGTYLEVGEPLQGRDDLVGPDRVHPNDAGYEVLARAVLAELPPT